MSKLFSKMGKEAADSVLADEEAGTIRGRLKERSEQGIVDPDPLVVVLTIGSAIKKRGLTQKEVAEKTGIRPAAISQLARGFVDRLTLDHLSRIAAALEITDIRELITLKLESELEWNSMYYSKHPEEYEGE